MKYEIVSDELRTTPRRTNVVHGYDPLMQSLLAGSTVKVQNADAKNMSSLYKEFRVLRRILHVRSFDSYKVLWLEPVDEQMGSVEIPIENAEDVPVAEKAE